MDPEVKVQKSWVTLQTDMYKEADIFILAILQPKARYIYIYIIIIIISECMYVDNNIRYGGTE